MIIVKSFPKASKIKYTLISVLSITKHFLDKIFNTYSLIYEMFYRIKHMRCRDAFCMFYAIVMYVGFPDSSAGRESTCNAGDL